MTEQRLKTALLLLTLAAIFGMFSGSHEPVIGILRDTSVGPVLRALHNGNSIVFNLSIGYLVSMLFWVLVVNPPRPMRLPLKAPPAADIGSAWHHSPARAHDDNGDS